MPSREGEGADGGQRTDAVTIPPQGSTLRDDVAHALHQHRVAVHGLPLPPADIAARRHDAEQPHSEQSQQKRRVTVARASVRADVARIIPLHNDATTKQRRSVRRKRHVRRGGEHRHVHSHRHRRALHAPCVQQQPRCCIRNDAQVGFCSHTRHETRDVRGTHARTRVATARHSTAPTPGKSHLRRPTTRTQTERGAGSTRVASRRHI
jgi:hypothetical protein